MALALDVNPSYTYFCLAARIDYTSAQTMAILMTRGVLQAKMYLKRFLKLASSSALGQHHQKGIHKVRSPNDETTGKAVLLQDVPSFGSIEDLIARRGSTAFRNAKIFGQAGPQANEGVGDEMSDEKHEDRGHLGGKSFKDVLFDRAAATEANIKENVGDELSFQKGIVMSSHLTAANYTTQSRDMATPINPPHGFQSNARVQIQSCPNLFIFADVHSESNNWRSLRLSHDHTHLNLPVAQSLFSPPVSELFFSASLQRRFNGFLDPETLLPICPVDRGLSQTFSLESVDPDVLHFLLARRAFSAPPYSHRPALSELCPFNEIRACYSALGTPQLAGGGLASQTPSSSWFLQAGR